MLSKIARQLTCYAAFVTPLQIYGTFLVHFSTAISYLLSWEARKVRGCLKGFTRLAPVPQGKEHTIAKGVRFGLFDPLSTFIASKRATVVIFVP